MNTEPATEVGDQTATRRSRRVSSRLLFLLRRIHLYAGLFLLPWVFLYGITGAMYNHYGLFPESDFSTIAASELTDSTLDQFPSAEDLAKQVIDAIQLQAGSAVIQLDTSHPPQFVNDIILQVSDSETKHIVHIDPVDKSAWVATTENDVSQPYNLLPKVKHIEVDSRPYELANKSVADILKTAGIDTDVDPQPQGWCKLNFLATVEGVPARITYVLRDGHVDVTEYDGSHDMSARGFFLRLHTTHGQPPHWNGRMFWSLFVDTMALAMVVWGVTGVIMWWQIKRTRIIGSVVIAISVATACVMYFGMEHFYATSRL